MDYVRLRVRGIVNPRGIRVLRGLLLGILRIAVAAMPFGFGTRYFGDVAGVVISFVARITSG